MSKPPDRRKTASLLNPFRGVQKMSRAARPEPAVERGLRVLRAQRPDVPVDELEWFGWDIEEGPRGRYVALGHDHRGYVVDGVSGHVLWEREIDGRNSLPRSLDGLR